MAREIWRPVVDFEDAYEVSDLGRVRGLERTCPHITGSRRVPPRLMTLTTRYADDTRFYFVVSLNADGAAVQPYVHHLVLAAFKGARPKGAQARHINRNTTDNRLKNLIWEGRLHHPPSSGGITRNRK